jgi:diguanylate cyclase
LRQEVETTRREAGTDSLTGIGNRKTFDGCLRQEAAQAMETGAELCLLMADIDFFKKFNDNHGHQIGDQVLKLLALTLTENIKGNDIAARYGGEEFAVILPSTGLKPAFGVAENIREKLSKKTILNKRTGKQLGSITLSIGVAQFEFGKPLARLISRADDALYSAKHQGRNMVVTAEPFGAAEQISLA